MGKQTLIKDLDSKFTKSAVPKIRTGHTVRVTQKIKEGDKERLQVFEGLVIRTHCKSGISATITVRKISEGIGVEKIFPIHSPSIIDIRIVKVAKVRKSKLYYMRERSGKSARLQETQTTQSQRDKMMLKFKDDKPSIPETGEVQDEKVIIEEAETLAKIKESEEKSKKENKEA